MKRRLLLLTFLAFCASAFLTSCTYEETVIISGNPHVDVAFDYWTGARNVEIDGSVINDGPIDVRSINMEFILLDYYGDPIASSWHQYRVNLLPGEEFFFSIDIRERGVYGIQLGRVEADGYY